MAINSRLYFVSNGIICLFNCIIALESFLHDLNLETSRIPVVTQRFAIRAHNIQIRVQENKFQEARTQYANEEYKSTSCKYNHKKVFFT